MEAFTLSMKIPGRLPDSPAVTYKWKGVKEAMKKYCIKITRRKDPPCERSRYSFGMIRNEGSKASPGERLGSLIAAQDEITVTFEKLVNENGFALDYNRHGGQDKIRCISTAFTGYLRAGDEIFEKALLVLQIAWGGHPDSLRHPLFSFSRSEPADIAGTAAKKFSSGMGRA